MEKHGLLGAIIGSNVEGRYIDEEEFWPFFECAEALGARLIVHAYRFPDDVLLKDYFLDNLARFVFDEGVSAARLIYAGVLERFPRLQLCIVHGGGFFPILLGRLVAVSSDGTVAGTELVVNGEPVSALRSRRVTYVRVVLKVNSRQLRPRQMFLDPDQEASQ